MRGVFALFLGAGLNAGVKTMIFDLSGGSGAILGTPRGSWWGQNLKFLSFDPRRHVRGVFALFLVAHLNPRVKTMIFGLSGQSGAILCTPRASWWGQLEISQF